MIDTLLFDLDNTLLDFDKAEANAITRALGDVGISVTNEMRDCYHKINLAQWKLLEQGKMTREEVKMRRFKLLFQEFDIKASPQEVAKHYQDYLGQGHYFIEGAEEVLQELSKRFRIYLVTNGTLSVQRGRLKSSGIEKYLQGVFISEEAEEQDSHNYDAKSDESDADQLREPEGNNTESHNHSSRNDSRQAVRALRLCIFTAIL